MAILLRQESVVAVANALTSSPFFFSIWETTATNTCFVLFLEATAENDLNCLLRQLEEVENTMRELEQDDGGFTRVRSAIIYFAWIDKLI